MKPEWIPDWITSLEIKFQTLESSKEVMYLYTILDHYDYIVELSCNELKIIPGKWTEFEFSTDLDDVAFKVKLPHNQTPSMLVIFEIIKHHDETGQWPSNVCISEGGESLWQSD